MAFSEKKNIFFNFGLLGCVDSRHRPFGEKRSLIIVWALGMRVFKTQCIGAFIVYCSLLLGSSISIIELSIPACSLLGRYAMQQQVLVFFLPI